MKTPARAIRTDVIEAKRNINNHTLAKITLEFAQLIYLASTRDYNTGQYYHAGLAMQFSEEVTNMALSELHEDLFRTVTLSPLEVLVTQVHCYLRQANNEIQESIRVWRKLEPFRVSIPVRADPLMAEMFSANVKLALAILACRPDFVSAVR